MGNDSDSDDDEEPVEQGLSTSERTDDHPRKRPHLDSSDVGRFASMSIAPMMLDLDGSKDAADDHDAAPPTTPCLPDSSSSWGAPPTTPTTATTPAGSTWEIDRYRTYVGSLDDEDDADAYVPPQPSSPPRRGSKATIPITRQEAEELERFKAAKDPAAMQEAEGAEPCLEVNPELLAKLEAHSQALLVGGDMSRRRSVPDRDTAQGTEGALVLWKSPEELMQQRAESRGHIASTSNASSNSSSATVTPLSTGHSTPTAAASHSRQSLFAFGTASPDVPFSPVFTGAAAAIPPSNEEMEMDYE